MFGNNQQPLQRIRRVQQINAVIEPKDVLDDTIVNSALRDHFVVQTRENLIPRVLGRAARLDGVLAGRLCEAQAFEEALPPSDL